MTHADDTSTLPPGTPEAAPMVLVVEDDSSLRTVMRRFLQGEGFAVIEVASGRAALDALRGGVTADYVVTDLKMADGSGGWLLAQLAYEHPHLLPRTVVISGDLEGAGAAHVAARWRCPMVAKPFTARELAAALRGVESGQPDQGAAP